MRTVIRLGQAMGMGMIQVAAAGTFGEDVAFLRKHTDVLVLARGPAQVAVVPAYQGRVMTSTTGGAEGPSFGWLNYKAIEGGVVPPEKRQGRPEAHIHIFGGEERFWLGPEGGQFSIFFAPGTRFVFDDWRTPAVIDTEPFEMTGRTDHEARFRREFELTNYSGARFSCRVERDVRLLDEAAAAAAFEVAVGRAVQAVAYETDNRLTNRGKEPWTRERGRPSIWLLGMYKPAPRTVVAIPFKAGSEAALGPKVNDAYFGKVPPAYLHVRDDVLFFKGDGTRRAKIGISPARSRGIAGSYDPDGKVLTLVAYNVPASHDGYVNSMWEMQKDPFGGDALNAYNDGSPGPGQAPLGPFYELETSSPAAACGPGESIRHVQRTIHIAGPEAELDRIARARLGVGLEEITSALSVP